MFKGKPFVKWVGGKRQIIDKLKEYVPDEYDTYYEPFIGGGALLFEKFKKMCNLLNHYEAEHSEEFYYEIRNKDKNKNAYNRLSDYTKAARTIYLNKACFNGLYRVNSKNEFNVPFGKKTKINTYEGSNLITVSNYLTMNNIKIQSVDFEESLKTAKKGDFVYIDPPYDSDTSTFNNYTEDGFGKEEQRRLAQVYKDLDKRGVYVMLSNHNTTLINELYKDYHIHIIEAKRNINANGKKRGKVEEVIITNYENKRDF